MDDYKDSKTTLIADVDCTAGGKSLCEKNGVSGYPTIKHGDPSDLKDYDGGRDLAALKKFAEENLGPVCGPSSLDLCDDADKKNIAKFQKWDVDELDLAIEEKDEKVKGMEKSGQKVIDKLNEQIKSAQESIQKEQEKAKSKAAKEKKKAGYAHMKAVLASKQPATEAAEEA